jgi:hypothetical protein
MYDPSPNAKYDHVFAIVRLDLGDAEPRRLDRKWITIKEIVPSMEAAEKEVLRLNKLNADKNCIYYWEITRLVREPLPLGGESSSTPAQQKSER